MVSTSIVSSAAIDVLHNRSSKPAAAIKAKGGISQGNATFQ